MTTSSIVKVLSASGSVEFNSALIPTHCHALEEESGEGRVMNSDPSRKMRICASPAVWRMRPLQNVHECVPQVLMEAIYGIYYMKQFIVTILPMYVADLGFQRGL